MAKPKDASKGAPLSIKDASRTAAPKPAARAPELAAAGRSVRKDLPRSRLGAWVPPPDRRDPVAILEEQAVGRVQDLIPLRYARMSASAFTFYRGAAALMAADLGSQAHHRPLRPACRGCPSGQLRGVRNG